MPAALALVAALLLALRLVLFLALHVRPGGIDPVRHTVSDYAASTVPATRRLAAVASWSAAGGWLLLGAAVLTLPGGGHTGLGTWLLVLGAVLALMPAVPTDGPGEPTTARGRLHLLLAIAWFTIAYSTMGPSARLLAEVTGSPAPAVLPVLAVLHTVGAVALVCLVVSLVVTPLRTRSFGLSERVFLLAVTLAPLIVATGLALA